MHALTCVSVRGCVIDMCERFVCVFVFTGARLCVCMRGPLPINASQEVENERFDNSGNMLYRQTYEPTDGQTNGRMDRQTGRLANTHHHHHAYHPCYLPFHHHHHRMSAQKI